MKLLSRQNLINIGLASLIVVITSTVLLLSFASKAVRYDNTAGVVHLRLQKKQYQVSAETIGTVSKVLVSSGQHVQKGDEMVDITNPILDKQIALLQSLQAANGAASLQLVDLLTQKEAQRMYAPTDGVVSDVVAEGQSVNTLQNVATIYSDSSVELTGSFNLSDYAAVQRNNGTLLVQDQRLNSEYPVVYAGARQVVDSKNNADANITLVFTLVNPEDAANMLQNEQVNLHLLPAQSSSKPIDALVNWYRSYFKAN